MAIKTALGALRYNNRMNKIFETHERQEAAKTPGQRAYEADCRKTNYYQDGTFRKPWRELNKVAQWSWERNPTPR